jgi:hypothetical protein
MAGRQWYAAIGGKQDGPFSDERLRELIAGGSVRIDTLVWCDGMSNWAQAQEIPGLIPAALRSSPPPASSAPAPARAGGSVPTIVTQPAATGQLGDDFRLAFDPQRTVDQVWPLFGRFLLLALCQILVIPLPWAATNFFRWLVDRIELPGRQRVAFTGKAEDIWYIFIFYGLCSLVGPAASLLHSPWSHLVPWLLLPLTTFFLLIITRWFYANLVWEGRRAPLQFTGGYWPMFGWSLLAPLSFFTVVGWAWVYTAWARWMCQHVRGTDREFIFVAGGWSYLWRTLTFVLSAVLLLPIPWTLRWYIRWLVAQFALISVEPQR